MLKQYLKRSTQKKERLYFLFYFANINFFNIEKKTYKSAQVFDAA